MVYYELRLVAIDKNWKIMSIKALKDGTRLSFKQCKTFVEDTLHGVEPVLYDGSDFNAPLRMMKELDGVNAEYELHNYYQ